MDQEHFLTSEERNNLIIIHRNLRDKKYADRIKAIILFDKGYSKIQICGILLIDKKTLNKIFKKYNAKGVDGVLTDNYKAYTGKLTKEQEEELKNDVRENTFSTAKEVCEHVRKKYDVVYRVESIVQLLHRLGFSYKKTKQVPGKADKVKQEQFVKKYEGLKENLQENEKIYFMDAVHAQHNSVPAYAWIETGKEKEIKTNTGRERININGVYSPIDHEIIVKQFETINAQTTIELFEMIEKKHPELDKIFIISDNARYYKARIVNDFLETSKIKIISLPPYSPNLNLIERLWKLMKKRVLYNKYYEKFALFKHAIDSFFRNSSKLKNDLESLMTENFHIFNSA